MMIINIYFEIVHMSNWRGSWQTSFKKIYPFFVMSKLNNYSAEETDFEHLILGVHVFDKLFNHNQRNVTKTM